MNHIGSVLQLTASGPPFVSLMRSFMATSVPSFWKPHSATVLPVSMSSCMAKEGFGYCRFRMYYECGRPAVMGLVHVSAQCRGATWCRLVPSSGLRMFICRSPRISSSFDGVEFDRARCAASTAGS
jgi:hypothetical protein